VRALLSVAIKCVGSIPGGNLFAAVCAAVPRHIAIRLIIWIARDRIAQD
jgi:hypothetical protein